MIVQKNKIKINKKKNKKKKDGQINPTPATPKEKADIYLHIDNCICMC